MLYLMSQESAPKSMDPYSDLNVLATLIKHPQSFLPGKLAWLLPVGADSFISSFLSYQVQRVPRQVMAEPIPR